jgi:hypothetical protein
MTSNTESTSNVEVTMSNEMERYQSRHQLVRSVIKGEKNWDRFEVKRPSVAVTYLELVRLAGLRAQLQVSARHMDGLA